MAEKTIEEKLAAKRAEIEKKQAAAKAAKAEAIEVVAELWTAYQDHLASGDALRDEVAAMPMLDDFTLPEIAEVFGVSEGTISTLRARYREINNLGPARKGKGSKGKGKGADEAASEAPAS